MSEYENDERMGRFLEAMEYMRKRDEEHILAAAEQSLAEVHTSDCPPPLTWHPYYRGKTHLLDWLNGVGPLAEAGWSIRLPKPRRVTMASADDLYPSAELSFDVITMTKQRAWGPAPWTGEPFHYEWYVGTDELGRQIAGDSSIIYEEGVRRWQALGLHP